MPTPSSATCRHTGVFGAYAQRIDARLQQLEGSGFLARLAQGDPALWASDPVRQPLIRNRLGWLAVPTRIRPHVDELRRIAQELHRDGFRHAVVLGMGGSSLFPDTCARTFSAQPGSLSLQVLDSTVPASVQALCRRMDLAKTLLLVSTKSGTTVETSSFFAYFAEQLRGQDQAAVGRHCIAITDPGTPLERLAREHRFRRTFLNPPDIGGRFSALSYFGLVPAALLGVEVDVLMDRVQPMVDACARTVSAQHSPGVWLGTALAELAAAGRDKVTFAFAPELAGFGVWVEQLLAESLGKDGKGVLPIDGEPLGPPEAYGADRVFVSLQLAQREQAGTARALQALESAGHPVIRIVLADLLELGAECFRWERATAVAGALLGLDPFDEPNVQESKDRTKAALAQLQQTGRLPSDAPAVEEGPLQLFGQAGATLAGGVQAWLKRATPGDYIGLMAYLPPAAEVESALQEIRVGLRDRLRLATTVGYGPRFLHSTGQFHKGGPNTGVFLQLTADHPDDVPIPGMPYTFGQLSDAQALGDWQALLAKGRRIIRVHLRGPMEAALPRLRQAVDDALAGLPPST